MKGKFKRLAALVTAAAAAFSSSAAFAEGSKDLINSSDNEGYRPYLEWRDRIQYGKESENVIYVYAKQGETVQLGTSVVSASDFSIASVVEKVPADSTRQYTYNAQYYRTNDAPGVTIPDDVKGSSIAVMLPSAADSKKAYVPADNVANFVSGSVLQSADGDISKITDKAAIYMFKPNEETKEGLIENRTQELAGPNAASGYTPITFTAPIEGTYAVRFLSSDYGQFDVPNRPATRLTGQCIGVKVDNSLVCSASSARSADAPAPQSVPEEGTAGLLAEETLSTLTGSPYDLTGCIGVISDNNYTSSDGKLYLSAGGYDTGAQAIKINNLTNWSGDKPIKRYIKYTPTENGKIKVKVKLNANASICITQSPSSTGVTPFRTAAADEKEAAYTSEVEVTANTDVYIYNLTKNAFYYEITFTPDGTTGGTETTKPTEEPTAEPTEEPTAEPTLKPVDVTTPWMAADFTTKEYDANGEVYSDKNTLKVVSKSSDSSKKIVIGNSGFSFNDNGNAESNCLVFMPDADGTVQVMGRNDNGSPRTINAVQTGVGKVFASSIPGRTTKAEGGYDPGTLSSDTAPVWEVKKGIPVCVYAGKGAVITGIKYTPCMSTLMSGLSGTAGNGGTGASVTLSETNNITINCSKTDKTVKTTGSSVNFNGGGSGLNLQYTPTESGRIRVRAKSGNTINISQRGYAAGTTLNNVATVGEWTDWVYVVGNVPVSFYSDKNGWDLYEIEFVATGETIKDLPELKDTCVARVTDSWVNNDATVPAWDVSVKAADGTAKPGRVWADILFMNMGAMEKGNYSKLNVLTDDGFLYNVDFNGMQPYSFMFYSNNRGYLLDLYSRYSKPELTGGLSKDSLKPLEHSFFSHKNSANGEVGDSPIRKDKDSKGNPLVYLGNLMETTILANHIPVDSSKDVTHKIFFETPDADALEAYTGKRTLKGGADNTISADKNAAIRNVLDSITYSGSGKAAAENKDLPYHGLGSTTGNIPVNCGTEGVGGNFTATIDEDQWKTLNNNHSGTKTLSIKLDFSNYQLSEETVQAPASATEAAADSTTGGTAAPVKVYKPVCNAADGTWATYAGESDKTEAAKNNIVTLSVVITGAGEYTLSWGGKDAYGNAVPYGAYQNAVKSYLDMGTAHFPLLDVEQNPNGIKIQMANNIERTDGKSNDTVYYNNEAVSPYYDPNASTSWYFVRDNTVDDSIYPVHMADGKNMLSGTSSNYGNTGNGVMPYTTEAGIANGDFTALDMWTKYEIEQNKGKINFGVNKSNGVSPYVSFVATDGTVAEGKITDAAAKGTFNNSHIAYQGQRVEELAENKGNAKVFGNTISTGYIGKLTTTSASENAIYWTITLPAGDNTNDGVERKYGDTYVKFNDNAIVSQAEADDAEYLAYEMYSQLLEDNAVQIEDDADGSENIGGEPGLLDGADTMGADDSLDNMFENEAAESESGIILEDINYYADVVEGTAVTAGDSNNLTGWTVNVVTDPVLTDETSVIENQGTIYKVNNFSSTKTGAIGNGGKQITLKVKQNLGTVITGNKSEITVGLVIDNLYAPSSFAEMSTTATDNAYFWETFVSGNNKNSINATSSDNYKEQLTNKDKLGTLQDVNK